MRFGRILLASLTALCAYSYANSASHSVPAATSDAFPRFLQAVMPLFVSAAESASPAPAPSTPNHAFFDVAALSTTSLAGSICLVASLLAVDLLQRRHQRALLRL